jgi:hypothetical protein
VGDSEATSLGILGENERGVRGLLFEVWETVKMTLIELMSRQIALVIEKAAERILYCVHQSK